MSPTAFVDAVSAWALAPGFTRARHDQWPFAADDDRSRTSGLDGTGSAAAADRTLGDDGRRDHTSDLGTGRNHAPGPAGVPVTGGHPSDHGRDGTTTQDRRHITDESEEA